MCPFDEDEDDEFGEVELAPLPAFAKRHAGGIRSLFPKCVVRAPVSLWGSGVEGVFARRCIYVRNRPRAVA